MDTPYKYTAFDKTSNIEAYGRNQPDILLAGCNNLRS